MTPKQIKQKEKLAIKEALYQAELEAQKLKNVKPPNKNIVPKRSAKQNDDFLINSMNLFLL